MYKIALGILISVGFVAFITSCSGGGTGSENQTAAKAARENSTVNVTVNLNESQAVKEQTGAGLLGSDMKSSESYEPPAKKYPPPPASESKDPQRLIHYYCKLWKDQKYKDMYGTLDERTRSAIPFEKFKNRLESDAEFNGGLKDENLIQESSNIGSQVSWKVQLVFRNTRAEPRIVVAQAVHTPDGYRISDSGIIPLDLNDL